MKYNLIYADPPWHFKTRSPKGEGRSASKHYPTMTLADIKRLRVQDIACPDSVLLMWATDPLLEVAFDVIKAWGFKYKTVGFYWVKENRRSPGWFTGLGYYTRANPEVCLLATRGDGLPRFARDVRRLVVAPRGAHSAKPPEVSRRIERLFGDVSRIEMFARSKRRGWEVWGNEVKSDVSISKR